MPTDPQLRVFLEQMERVRRGDPEAVRTLVEEYGADVARFVRRYQTRKLRSKFDLEDFVQDVWKAFFRKVPALEFDHPHALRGFLFRLAHNQVVATNLHFLRTRKSDVRREVSLEGLLREGQCMESPEPPPWKRVECQDEIDGLLKKWPHRLGHGLVRRLGEGYSQKDAARDLNVSEKTVGRLIACMRLRAGGAE
jgi:RNA polymerase sigma factor (sigma-70 family)